VLGVISLVLTYSRGAWMGMVASLGLLGLALVLRTTRAWPPLWRRLLPIVLLGGGALVLVVLITQVEPLRVRVLSLVAGREDSSNNFRMNVWTSALQMIRDRPWIGIGPGNTIFNLIYPLYQQPKFNALSAYSIPLEWLVEAGVPGLITGAGLFLTAVGTGLRQWRSRGLQALPSLAAVAAFVGLAIQGLTDTIFFRPEVQLIAMFSLATLAAFPAGAVSPGSSASSAPFRR
jgi:putative inorganic carbon (HCO3(-)) transporter